MDALYFRVSSDRQTTENQFEDLLQIAEKDGSERDWNQIRQALANCVHEDVRLTSKGGTRTVYRASSTYRGGTARTHFTEGRTQQNVPGSGGDEDTRPAESPR